MFIYSKKFYGLCIWLYWSTRKAISNNHPYFLLVSYLLWTKGWETWLSNWQRQFIKHLACRNFGPISNPISEHKCKHRITGNEIFYSFSKKCRNSCGIKQKGRNDITKHQQTTHAIWKIIIDMEKHLLGTI